MLIAKILIFQQFLLAIVTDNSSNLQTKEGEISSDGRSYSLKNIIDGPESMAKREPKPLNEEGEARLSMYSDPLLNKLMTVRDVKA